MWGSGCQAHFQLECKEQKAWIRMHAQLGGPADRHFTPQHTQEHYGYHVSSILERNPHLSRKETGLGQLLTEPS